GVGWAVLAVCGCRGGWARRGEAALEAGRLDAPGFGVTLTGPAPPVGLAAVVLVVPQAATVSARPATSAAYAAGAARKECSRMANVLTQDWQALAQSIFTVA